MKTVKITYFVHGTTTDNEAHLATGWAQGELSAKGREQAVGLWEMVKEKRFDVVFSSDLKRAVESAELCFGAKVPLKQDKRLRECNYGDLTQTDFRPIEDQIVQFIEKPFPNGESYLQVEARIRDFLKFLLENYAGKRVAIMAHQAPQLALEVIVNGKSWPQAMKEDWRKKQPKEWRPGWDYEVCG